MRLNVTEKLLPRLQLAGMLALVLVLSLSLGAYFTFEHVREFRQSQASLEASTIKEQEALLHHEVGVARDYLDYVRSTTETVLKAEIRDQVDQVFQMANAIYQSEKGRRPDAEIRHLILEALRPMRFHEGRGYFFVDDLDGKCILLPTAPHLEGTSFIDNRDDTGGYIMRGLIASTQNASKSGYSRYRWYIPGDQKQMADKIAYVRVFEPFNWIIGTGEYRYKVEEDLQKKALERLRATRFGKNGYLAALKTDGTVLLSPSKPELEGMNIAELQAADQDALRTMLASAKHGGGTIRYDWLHPATQKQAPKISVVTNLESWGWVLLASVYLDDLESAMVQRQTELEEGIGRRVSATLLAVLIAMSTALGLSFLLSRWLTGLFQRYRSDIDAGNARLRVWAKVFESGTEAMLITDADNRIIEVNETFSRITGYSRADAVGQTPHLLNSGHHDAAFYQEMWRSLTKSGSWAGEIWNQRKDGSVYPEWLNITVARNAGGEITNYVSAFSDITDRMAYEERLRRLAEYDPLTNLPNRVLLLDRLIHAIALIARNGGQMAVIFLDLDRFKNINDSLGHAVGDKLLVEVAHRLRGVVRASDTVSRLGGDEFVILLPDLEHADYAAHIAEKLLRSIADLYDIDGRELSITPSLGIALYPADGSDPETLLKNADAAMYFAKERGRNNYQFFAAEMNARVSEHLALENNLRQAIARQELSLHYQPQFDLASGELIGYEALMRWNSATLGSVPPGRFIPIAEDSGLILSLGEWALREACRQNRAWQLAGLRVAPVAVNISAVQFRHADIAELVASVLAESGLAPGLLEVEVTESVLMEDVDLICDALQRIKSLGVALAMDDFGTGYSSLSYLKRFHLDKLKIDRSFIMDLPNDADDAALTVAIIGMAAALGLATIAEGVESEAQCDFLREKGCQQVQGYLFARPLPAAELAQRLALEAEPR